MSCHIKQKEENTTILTGAVYGAGFMGRTHMEAYRRLSGVHITAVIDPVAERAQQLADTTGAGSFCSIAEAAYSCHLDFIDICIPTPYHADAIKEAFEHACHVLVEKPMTAAADDLLEIQYLAAEASKRLMVAHVCRFIPSYIYAKEISRSERLGSPILFSARRYSQTPDWSMNDWINNRTLSGGTIVDLSIHDIDIANWIFGSPVAVYGSEAVRIDNGPAHVLETIEYSRHRAAHIEASHLMPNGYGLTSEYQLVLEHGLVSCQIGATGMTLREFSEGKWKAIDPSGLVIYTDPYTEELYHFTSCLRTGEPFRISFDEAVTAVQTALALRGSVDTGETVRL